MQLDHIRRPRRSAERNQPGTTQHQPADVPVAAVVRIFEAERAFEAESTIVAPVKAQARRVHGLVEPLHPGGMAGIAAKVLGAFGCRTAGTPEGEGQGCDDHHNEQSRHPPNVAALILASKFLPAGVLA